MPKRRKKKKQPHFINQKGEEFTLLAVIGLSRRIRTRARLWLDNTRPLKERMEVIKRVGEGFLDTCKIDQVGNEEDFEHVVFH